MAGDRRSISVQSIAQVFGMIFVITMAILAMSASASASPPRYELVKKFGSTGSEVSGFAYVGPVAVDQVTHVVYAAEGNVSTPGKLYKFDTDGNPVNWGGSALYISGNEISGLDLAEEGKVQIAVDSATHTVYATTANSIRAFQANGEPSEFTAGPGAGSSEIGGFVELAGLAVDVNGYIYASDRAEGIVKIYAPSGEMVNQFATETPANLAVDSTGAVYVVNLLGPVTKFIPSPFPVTGDTTYSAALAPVDSFGAETVGVDPTTNVVYVSHSAISGHTGVSVYAEDGTPVTEFGEPGSEGELLLADGIAIDGTGTKVYVGNPVPPSGPSQVYIFRKEPPAAPRIELLAAGSISGTSATLYARINPDQRSTTYRFEYGLSDCSTSVCTTVPVGGALIVAGNDGVWVAEKIQGLSPGTVYHYLVIAENELGSDEASGVFSTQTNAFTFELSDSRAWEMVSPPSKGRGVLRGTQSTRETSGQVQAAVDGNGITYTSTAPIQAEPEGSRAIEPASILTRRGANGWESDEISPPNAKVTPIPIGQQGEFKLFSQDLSSAVLDNRSGTLLSDEASERTPYLRVNSDPPTYRPLVTGKEGFANVPAGTVFGGGENAFPPVTIQNATPDLSHVVLESKVPLVEDAPSFAIYEWTDGQLDPISVLPDAEGSAVVRVIPSASSISVRHAISDDGSRVFWTGEEPKRLFMRDMEAEETVQIDKAEEGVSGPGEVNPVFQGASADGSIVYFSDTQQLTVDASPTGTDLYRCEIVDVTEGCANLVDLTAPREGSGESGDLQGIASGLTADGSRAYFVAKGVLTTEANQFGDEAVGGQPNLYLWQNGDGLRFIARLATEDRPNWGIAGSISPSGEASKLSTAVSPGGRYFAFMSERDLTDQGNVDVSSGEAVERIFRFDADAGRLACVSCPTGGAAPQGALVDFNELVDPRSQWLGRHVAATLPQPEILSVSGPTIYQPRVLLDNGRVFFNAIDSLVPADSNKQWDVYQYEDLGVGSCGVMTENAAMKRSGEGCVSLMSSGSGEAEVGFLDASATGNDVFFLTPARLSVTDVDDALDVYDARVNGVPAVLTSKQACDSAESCHPLAPPVQGVTPGSASFNGSGNVKPSRKCPKGKRKVKRHGKQRCVPRKGKHQRRAGQRKRASR
jgi:hypothetical protein